MTKELVIHSKGSEIEIALLEDGQLVEMSQEKGTGGFSVGDIYVGKVRKVMSGLNAAFVDVGYEKDAFLHYLDLGAQFSTLHRISKTGGTRTRPVDISREKLSPPLPREGKIDTYLATGDSLIVQIAKEPISTKGPRLTSEISLAGRHLVLMPLSTKVNISQKIRSNEERRRLKKIVEGILPHNFGAIVRTAAEGKTQEDIETDIKSLLDKWSGAVSTLQTAKPVTLLLGEDSRTTTILRDLLNDSFSKIHVDTPEVYHAVREYISAIEPDAEKIVKLYKGSTPIFDEYEITKQIKQQFGRTVPFRRGAYLIVEHTEALHVIDVNSGKRAKADENQEQNALECNMNAVPEIARQLRLKDMGGIVVIDFIDLHIPTNRNKVYEAMKEAMAKDRAKHNILPLTKFCLMQITRQRVRPETKIVISESCPTCHGTGQVAPTLLLDEQIEARLAYLMQGDHKVKSVKIHVHPFVASFLRRGIISKRMRWSMKYHVSVKVIENDSVGMIDYHILGPDDRPL
ncbi:MAG: Rne/Rng family ribonuclease [Mucinivorans sp.]